MPNNVTIKSAFLYLREKENVSHRLAEIGKDIGFSTVSVFYDMEKPKPFDSVQENREFKETHLQITFDDENIDPEKAALALKIAKEYGINVLALTEKEGLIVNSATDLKNLATIQQGYLGKGDMFIIDARPKTVCMGQ
jgi:hypothetical protein